MLSHVHSPEAPLNGEFDLEAEIAAVPPNFVVKGMFFSRLRERLGADFQRLLPQLSAQPRLGRYIAFTDYPQRDYVRLSVHAAQKRYPGTNVCEALRRLARDDFHVFAESTVGKVMLTAVSDARRALLMVPSVYAKVAKGDWKILAEELSADTVRLDFMPAPGRWEYQLGQLEGVVIAMNGRPRITVYELPEQHMRYDVQLL